MHPAARQRPNRRSGVEFGALIAMACTLLLLALAQPAAGAQAAQPQGGGFSGLRLAPLDPELPWQIEAERISYDQVRDEYLAEGEVRIFKQDRAISADRVRYSPQTRMAFAEGQVRVTAGSDRVAGSYLEFDLESEKGYLDHAEIFIAENNYRLSGERIDKIGPDLYAIDRGAITTCDGAPPDWKITGRDIKVHDDGSGSAWNALVHVRDVPVAYFPYVSFPARNKRQTGFLFPEIGYTSRKGVSYNQPFFWVIDDQSDATFYTHYMSKRGLKPGLEYRYYLTAEAKGAVLFDFLHDEQTDTGFGNTSKDWGYDDSGGVFLRPNQDRYWFRMSHYNPLPWGATARLDLDIVSDQDYLHEFKKGYMGFEDSRVFFKRFFGRTLDDYDDPVRQNQLLVSRAWSGFSLSAATLLYEDSRKGQNWKDTTQRLPVVRASAPKQPIADLGFYYNLTSEYDNFWQQRGYGVQRMDLWPRLYYPYTLAPYFTLEPSIGYRQTLWDQYATGEADPWSSDRYFHRELPDTRVSLYTDLYRIYETGLESATRLKHSLRPELIHTYVPDVDQDDLPFVDSRDRIVNRNRIGYYLTNTFTSKALKRPIAREGDPRADEEIETIQSDSEYDYRDVLRVKVGQWYDFARHDEPLGPVTGKLSADLAEKIGLKTEAEYNTYQDRLDRFNASVAIGTKKKAHLFLEYRYDRDTRNDQEDDEYDTGQIIEPEKKITTERINALRAELRLGLTDSLSIVTSYERDFFFDRTASYGLGFIYESQCWTLETMFGLDEGDLGFGMRVKLHGIGEIGF